MAKSRFKFYTKLKILLSSCCALILTFTLAVNLILALNKGKITGSLNQGSPEFVGIGNIFYLPPNILILRNLCLSESKMQSDKKILNITLSYFSFSLPELLTRKSLRASSFSGIGFSVNSGKLLGFLKNNFPRILNLITSLPEQDFQLSLRRIRFISAENVIYSNNAQGSLSLSLKKQRLSASGALGRNMFNLQGLLSKGEVGIESFKLDNGIFNCQFWGRLNSSLAEFRGFILPDNPDKAKKPSEPKLFILDIDSRIKFSFPQVVIERLNFSVNKNPVKITAMVFLNEPLTCDLKLFSDFRSMDNSNSRLKKVSLAASLVLEKDNIIKIAGRLNIDFPEYKKDSLPLEKLKAEVKNLVLNFQEPGALKISVSALNLFSKTSANQYDINLEDLNSLVYPAGKNSEPIKFSSRFYGGRLEGRAKIEMQDFFPVISADISVKDVDANKLEGLLIHFSKIYGKLSGEMFFINYPQLIFKGSIHMHSGYLINFEFLKWLANLFDLPSLKKVGFNAASSDFIADKDGVGMYGMALDSENLKINGDFKLKEADMVASTISISLRKKLLQESAKFNTLLNLLGTKQDQVKFNFQLSGNLHNMNFRWLKSDFKDKLQRVIPDFAERRLERTLEGIIESIAE